MQRRRWNPRSRNELILERNNPTQYADHTAQSIYGIEPRRFYYVDVHNMHHSKTATNCYAYLESVVKQGNAPTEIPFNSVELKWSGYTLPNAHILPSAARPFDALAIFHRAPVEPALVTFSDSLAFGFARIDSAGEYEFRYAVVSDNFPIARRSFVLSLSDRLDRTELAVRPVER